MGKKKSKQTRKKELKPLKSETTDYGFLETGPYRVGDKFFVNINGEWKLGVVEADMVRVIEN